MNRDFLFTVIVAACNAEGLLPVTVDSIVDQNVDFIDSIEIIIVNDGSTDATGEVARGYAKLYPDNIRVFDKGYGGVASARNVGLRMAQGRYINFCEPGGSFDAEVFSAVALFFNDEENDTSLVAISSSEHEPIDEFFNYFKRTRVIALDHTSGFYQPEFCAYFFKRSVCALLSFDENLGDFSDLELLYRILAKKNSTVGVVEKIKYHPKKNPEQSEQRIDRLLNEFIPTILRYYRDRYNPPLPRFFLTMVMRLFCDIFAGSARLMKFDIDRRRAVLNGIRPILTILNENMLRGDRYISEDALAFCLSIKPNPQEFLKDNFPEFDALYSITVVIPVDGDEELLTSLRQAHCENLEIIRSSRHAALQKATGDFIVFLEKDDRVDADLFRVMLRRLSLDRVSICCCGYRDRDGKTYSPKGLEGIVTPAVAASASLPISTFMFKTALLRNRSDGIEDISGHNPYFYLSVLRKNELSTIGGPHLTLNFKETRSIEQIFGDKQQRTIDPLSNCYNEYESIKHFSRFL